MNNAFNLIDEPWIAIQGRQKVGLKEVFSDASLTLLGGNSIEKVTMFKLLMAIAQSAFTPRNDVERDATGIESFKQRCQAYLTQWHDAFYLYGDKPFLQMPSISASAEKSFNDILTEVASGNTTRVGHYQIGRVLSDADKALNLVIQMSAALGGKKPDNSLILTPGYTGKLNEKGKPSTSRPGQAIGYMGFLHSFIVAPSLIDTLWLNLLSHEQIQAQNMFPGGIGQAPWEQMPEGEDCRVARDLKQSMMGRLVPLSRFCLFTGTGLHYTEGLQHGGYSVGMNDPTVSVDYRAAKPKALWVNPSKRPWRELTSLLSFLEAGYSGGFSNIQLTLAMERIQAYGGLFAVWSGGLSVSANAGEQYAAASDDYVDSIIWLDSQMIGEDWFVQLKNEMALRSQMAKSLYGAVSQYYSALKATPSVGQGHAQKATDIFWTLSEKGFPDLINACVPSESASDQIMRARRQCIAACNEAYNTTCPDGSSRQMDAWAQHLPKLNKYLKGK